MKDAAFLSRCEDPGVRCIWRSRIEELDGEANRGDGEGGIRRWLCLATSVGLDADYVASASGVLPATRFAVDACVKFLREAPFFAAVAASLTELFAPAIHQQLIAGLLKHHDFATPETLDYFKNRLEEAPKDVAFGLAYVLDTAPSQEDQDRAVRALEFKTDVLWGTTGLIVSSDGKFLPCHAAQVMTLLTFPKVGQSHWMRFGTMMLFSALIAAKAGCRSRVVFANARTSIMVAAGVMQCLCWGTPRRLIPSVQEAPKDRLWTSYSTAKQKTKTENCTFVSLLFDQRLFHSDPHVVCDVRAEISGYTWSM